MDEYFQIRAEVISRLSLLGNFGGMSAAEATAGVVWMVETAKRFHPLVRTHLLGCFPHENIDKTIRGLLLLQILEEVADGKYQLAQGIVPDGANERKDRGESRIYFAQTATDGPIKIGYTTDLEKRVRSLQTGNATAVRVLVSVPGTLRQEAELHGRFRALRLSGEWFRPEPELVAFIRQTGLLGRLP